MAVELHERQTIGYKLQRRQVEGKDNPYWRPQGLKLSPTLFSFYIADMPRPTEPVRRIFYADDIAVWASGVKISELDQNINTYLTGKSRFLWENLLLISAPKSSVTLFMPDLVQANTRLKVKIADSELPHVRSPKILEWM